MSRQEPEAMLQVCEIFYSVQGEGLHSGMPSVFVRFSGCNLACTWCDTPYASRPGPADTPREMRVAEVLAALAPYPAAAHVVLTGGEPMLQADLPELTDALAAAGRCVTIETNATLPPGRVRCDLGSLSPKLPGSQPDGGGALDPDVVAAWLAHVPCQLKFVIRHITDVEAVDAFLSALPAPPAPERVFLMPEGRDPRAIASASRDLVQACLERGMRYGRRLQLDLFGDRRGT
jgi:7-carboxy-7-deazaguanine synthase